ncbi:MAG: small ribosomal subunit Rsm22 family protein [Planctomycetota bacterium]|nr:small ribosomal subunit Rsm22 family protein [Planctomycetota bacterium]MDW8372398.1 small ribosomal subunit Rsm22 family protein [Planctomycetota bacterium]
MTLPPELWAALDALPSAAEAASAWQRLQAAYRAQGRAEIDEAASALAYAWARMPATVAAIAEALRRAGPPPWRSLLDLGAGCGAGWWAARWRCPQLELCTAVERSPALRALGARLAPEARWLEADLRQPPSALPVHDGVLFAYSLGELPSAARAAALAWAWERAGDGLLLVEPGTPAGAAVVQAARCQLLALGARLVAPCPHEGPCPLPTAGWGWCHFAVRLPRHRRQRHLKGGALLGWEEERFAWLLARRQGAPLAAGRVLAPPARRGGGISVLVCDGQGAQQRTVYPRDPAWPAARRCRWGDPWPAR